MAHSGKLAECQAGAGPSGLTRSKAASSAGLVLRPPMILNRQLSPTFVRLYHWVGLLSRAQVIQPFARGSLELALALVNSVELQGLVIVGGRKVAVTHRLVRGAAIEKDRQPRIDLDRLVEGDDSLVVIARLREPLSQISIQPRHKLDVAVKRPFNVSPGAIELTGILVDHCPFEVDLDQVRIPAQCFIEVPKSSGVLAHPGENHPT